MSEKKKTEKKAKGKYDAKVVLEVNEAGELVNSELHGNIASILSGFSACIMYLAEEHYDGNPAQMIDYMHMCIDKVKEAN